MRGSGELTEAAGAHSCTRVHRGGCRHQQLHGNRPRSHQTTGDREDMYIRTAQSATHASLPSQAPPQAPTSGRLRPAAALTTDRKKNKRKKESPSGAAYGFVLPTTLTSCSGDLQTCTKTKATCERTSRLWRWSLKAR